MKKSAQSPDYVTRGRLAKETGTNIETVRYYEKIGLLPDADRDRSAIATTMHRRWSGSNFSVA